MKRDASPYRLPLQVSAAGIPALYLNGASAAIGTGVVGLLVAGVLGGTAAQLAVGGSICASLSDVPNTVDRIRQRVMLAAVLTLSAALVIQACHANLVLLCAGIFFVGFVAMMTLSWGAWANSLSFAALLSAVFALATPETSEARFMYAAWIGLGGFLYWIWASCTSPLLQGRYRVEALRAAVQAMAEQLTARASLLEATSSRGDSLLATQAWALGESVLAERLQAARNFIYADGDSPDARRHSAILLSIVEMRDLLLASRLDLEIVGVDSPGKRILGNLALALRAIAADLKESSLALEGGRAHAHEPGALDFSSLFEEVELDTHDVRRRLIALISKRLGNLGASAMGIRQLLCCSPQDPLLGERNLKRLVVPESWPLLAIRDELRWNSPVLRHAIRTSIAICCAYLCAILLPWAAHPYWVVLSVVVVLRGNLAQTLERRNARVFGTMLGCLLVAVISVLIHQEIVLELVFVAAVGIAHAFITRRYWLTALAAAVMALLQSHFIAPDAGLAVVERASDTLAGAALAWAFSYVLPSWERRDLPNALQRAMTAMAAFASQVLRPAPVEVGNMRLARRQAYDSLTAISDAMQRSAVEPRAVRIPSAEVTAFLDHAQRVMAHLSTVRVILAGANPELGSPAIAAEVARAEQAVKDAMTGSRDSAGHLDIVGDIGGELPEEDPRENVLPWLHRRLEILVSDAVKSRQAANSAELKLDMPQEIDSK